MPWVTEEEISGSKMIRRFMNALGTEMAKDKNQK